MQTQNKKYERINQESSIEAEEQDLQKPSYQNSIKSTHKNMQIEESGLRGICIQDLVLLTDFVPLSDLI